MNAQDVNHEPLNEEESAREADNQDGELVASKLSRELSNWRRKRNAGRPRGIDGPSGNYHSDAARTIKVRGHETLVIRKPKLNTKTMGGDRQIP